MINEDGVEIEHGMVVYEPWKGGYYRKSEADKVIEELELKLARTQLVLRLNEPEALYSNLDTMGRLKHQIDVVELRERHHKYKRCLAMAWWCESEAYIHEHGSDYDEDLVAWFGKWYKRWMKLAEKFKEAK